MTKKTISELRLQDDSITRNGTVILEQIENYYRNLYTSDLIFSETSFDTFTDIVESPNPPFRGRARNLGASTFVRRMQKDTRNLSE